MLSFDEADMFNYGLLKQYAKENRNNMTEAESVLWNVLRCNALGHKFLRQYIIGNYIVDFICRDEGLIIEVDGGYHSEPRQQSDDMVREDWLREKGYHVMRFSNDEVLFGLEDVIESIESYFN